MSQSYLVSNALKNLNPSSGTDGSASSLAHADQSSSASAYSSWAQAANADGSPAMAARSAACSSCDGERCRVARNTACTTVSGLEDLSAKNLDPLSTPNKLRKNIKAPSGRGSACKPSCAGSSSSAARAAPFTGILFK
ncbi:unknown [Singapore grouper iridovirus]|uniref:Uncharacterized protein n=1 Tax=Singapore grouper iridovirus TaxID=262968 RepID=Q5YFK7_9VIRU|nr:hypothetical protein ORF058R [Singapore grouper iridovirus]AAS18073.1 unknown [Singapore grouper iridovirus]WAU86767.1 hypothetical protein ORF058R [Singapore grouper iridovirus]